MATGEIAMITTASNAGKDIRRDTPRGGLTTLGLPAVDGDDHVEIVEIGCSASRQRQL